MFCPETAALAASMVMRELRNDDGVVDPSAYGLPILKLTGDTSAMTKDNAVDLQYVYGDRSGTASVKWQGSSSLSYPKKNYTIKFDNAFEASPGWGEQKKYCLKANFIDHSHARNVVSAKLWGDVVDTRLGNGDGAVTDVLTKEFAVDPPMPPLSYETANFTSSQIFKQNNSTGGRLHVEWDTNKMQGLSVYLYLIDLEGNLYKHTGNIFTADGSATPQYGFSGGDLDMDAWYNPGIVYFDAFTVNQPFSIPVPNGYSVLMEIEYVMAHMKFPDGTLTTTWSSEAEANNTWHLAWAKNEGLTATIKSVDPLKELVNHGAIDGFPCIVMHNDKFHGLYTWNIPKDGWMFGMRGVSEGVEEVEGKKEAIFCADATSQATRFLTEATLTSDFELEYVADEDNPDWALTSLNRLIRACLNSDGSDLDTTIAQYLDWNSAIDYYCYCCLVGGADMAGKNYLLATFDGNKWRFSPYDMDSTFGLWWNGKEFLTANHYPTIGWYASYHTAMKLILQHKKDALKARYAELRKGPLSESNIAVAFCNFISKIPSKVFDADVERWPTIPSSAVNNVSQILNWYRMRVAVLDKEMESL